MTWYKVKLSDGSDHRLWFGHDPSEQDVLEAVKAPTMSQGKETLPERADEPATGKGGSRLQRALGTEADPNSPEKLIQGAMFAGSMLPGPRIAAAGSGALGAAARMVSKPAVAGAIGGGVTGAIEGGPKHALLAAAAGAGLGGAGHGISKYVGKAIAKTVEAQIAKQTPAIEQATTQLVKALVENGMKEPDARRIATNQIAQMMAKEAPAAAKAVAPAVAKAAPRGYMGPPHVPTFTPEALGLEPIEAAGAAAVNQEQLKVVNMAQALLKEHSGNKAKVKALLQEMYPQSWEEMMNIITAKNTKPATIYIPKAK